MDPRAPRRRSSPGRIPRNTRRAKVSRSPQLSVIRVRFFEILAQATPRLLRRRLLRFQVQFQLLEPKNPRLVQRAVLVEPNIN